MAYCAKTDLEQRFGAVEIADLLDRDHNGTEDSGVLAQTIGDADALIDGYLGSRYAVPLSTIPDLVKAISCDIVRFLLWDDNAPDEIRKRYDDRIKQLRDIANGMISLPATTTASTTGGNGGVEYEGNERVFTMDTLAGF